MSKFTTWRKENPKTWIAVLAVVGTLLFVGGAQLWKAYGQTLNIRGLPCPTPTWDPATATVSCGQIVVVPPTQPPIPPQPPTDDYAYCKTLPQGYLRIAGQWGNTAIPTNQYGAFKDNILTVEVFPPATWTQTGTKQSNWAQYMSSPTVREGVLSTKACSFDRADAMKLSNGNPMWNVGLNQQGFVAQYSSAAASTSRVQLIPGQKYWVNIRNVYGPPWSGQPSCTISDCDMRGGIPQ